MTTFAKEYVNTPKREPTIYRVVVIGDTPSDLEERISELHAAALAANKSRGSASVTSEATGSAP